MLPYGVPPEFRGGVRSLVLNHHTPSDQSRVYRITQLRTNGAHCRESAGTRPVNLKVLSNECYLDPFNDWGGERGCNNFVPALGGNGTKIAPTGDIFDQPPGQIR